MRSNMHRKLWILFLTCIISVMCTACRKNSNVEESASDALEESGQTQRISRTLWISPKGNDESDGTRQAPLATTEEALNRLREETYTDATLIYEGGRYDLEEPIVLNETDHDILFCAAEGEEPQISGAHLVSGWSTETVNGIEMWVTDIPEGEGEFMSLFSEKGSLSRSRWPKEGYFEVASEDNLPIIMSCDPDDLLAFSRETEVTVKILHKWKDETIQIKAMDLESGQIILSNPTALSVSKGDRYYFENVWEAFSEQGEWYLNDVEGKLYYIPLPGEEIDSTQLYAARLNQLLICDGASNIRFDGLHFTMGDWELSEGQEHHQAAYDVAAALDFTNTRGVSLQNCSFSFISSSCLKFGYNVQDITVVGNEFCDIGANVIILSGVNAGEGSNTITEDFLISNNHIQRYGQRFFNGVAIAVLHAAQGEISNNEIHDGYMSAISLGWVWGYDYSVTSDILVKQNLIYNIGQGLLSDMGAIYSLGVKEGIEITENVIHDVNANMDVGYGGWGIYMDEGSSNVMITKNLVYDCSSTAFYQNYGQDNLVINNIFAFCKEGQVSSYQDQDHTGFHLIRNIIVSDGSDFICHLQGLAENNLRNRFNEANNTYWDYQNGDQGIDAEWYIEKLGIFHMSVFREPGFVDWENRDFTLKKNSWVLLNGFIEWDISTAGLLQEEMEI